MPNTQRLMSKNDEGSTAGLTCSMCRQLYVSPKLLPQCGHTFCLACVRKIVDKDRTSIVCPECKLQGTLGKGGPNWLKPNYAVEKAIENLRRIDSIKTSSRDCPHAGVLPSNATCHHCNGRFCSGCAAGHMESLKLEIGWIGSDLCSRLEKLKSGKYYDQAEQVLSKQASDLKAAVNSALDEYDRQIFDILKQRRDALLAKVDELVEAQLSKVREGSKVDNFSSISAEDMQQELEKVANTSILYTDLAAMANLHEKYESIDKELASIEAFNAEVSRGTVGRASFELGKVPKLEAVMKNDKITWITNETPDAYKGEKAKFLHALEVGDLDLIKEILSRKTLSAGSRAFILQFADCGQQLVQLAASKGDFNLLKTILNDQLSNIAVPTEAVHEAATRGHLEVLDLLLSKAPGLLERSDWNDATLLVTAAENGQLGIVKWLIDSKQAKVNPINSASPLVRAVKEGKLEVVKFLVEKGADVEVKAATFKETDSLIEDLVGVVHFAASRGWKEILRYFLGLKPELTNARSEKGGFCPLHFAAGNGHLEIAEMLVQEFGAKVDIKSSIDGQTPSETAKANGHDEVASFLDEAPQNQAEVSE